MPHVHVSIPIFFGKGVSNVWMAKEWLSNNSFYDEILKKDVPYLISKVAWHDINLPFLKEKVKGNTALTDLIRQNLDQIRDFIYKEEGIQKGS